MKAVVFISCIVYSVSTSPHAHDCEADSATCASRTSSLLQVSTGQPFQTKVPDESDEAQTGAPDESDEEQSAVLADEVVDTETHETAFKDYISGEMQFDSETDENKFLSENKKGWEQVSADVGDDAAPAKVATPALIELRQTESDFKSYLAKHFKFANQTAMSRFVAEHLPAWQTLARPSADKSLLQTEKAEEGEHVIAREHISRGLLSSRASCTKVYSGQYFKERINLCTNSFTGVSACSEPGCHIMASFLYGSGMGSSTCHSIYYSNAENKAGGMGMCRCLPGSETTWRRYYSSSGNNIYNCYSR